ncbi:MAG: alpha/beta hydrolase [Bacteroidaceae bacterium]|nr:alpha/beta hydrolase [Bacteroidaceae bacterium]
MKGKRLMTAAFTLLMGMAASAQEGLLKETIAYRDTFKMDVYVNPSVKVDGKRPVFIHTHGGGWNSGDRNINAQTGVWADMLREGMVVVSIDYRQGVAMARAEGKLKDMPVVSADSKEAFDGEEVSPIIRQSILWGVEDLYDATTYVLQHADRWNADPECVILGGGSAGAIESLTAE